MICITYMFDFHPVKINPEKNVCSTFETAVEWIIEDLKEKIIALL